MDKKVSNTTEEDVRASISSIYSDVLNKRQIAREAREEERRQEKAARDSEKAERYTKSDGTKMTKKERRQAEFDNWKEIVVGLTGDDLDYARPKGSKKKKYRKWIGEDDIGSTTTVKQRKPKKRNYNKEFEPELNMLRNLVSEQNKFTAELQKRFQNAIGPATKDAMVPNKTMVELAAAITSGRSNSLGMLREIGNIKKNIATLYMNQRKLDSQLGGISNADDGDLGLMGSNLAASLFGDNGISFSEPSSTADHNYAPSSYTGDVPQSWSQPQYTTPITPLQVVPSTVILPQDSQSFVKQGNDGMNNNTVVSSTPIQPFDPSTWVGPTLQNSFTESENIPHTIVVEKDSTSGNMRFVAIRDDDGSELSGCNIPTVDPNTLTVNEKDKTVKGQFDEVYPLRYV